MNINAGIAPEPGSAADEDCDILLYNNICSQRDGTGETCRVLSWIWLTHNADHSDQSDNILRIEWAKSRARAARSREEVLLLKEEMRRVLAFLDWNGNQWRLQAQGTPEFSDALFEDKRAFLWKQRDIQSSLSQHFCYLWTKPLNQMAGKIFVGLCNLPLVRIGNSHLGVAESLFVSQPVGVTFGNCGSI